MSARGKNPKNVWWNDMIRATVERKEAAWKGMLIAGDEVAEERCMEPYKKEKKRCIY